MTSLRTHVSGLLVFLLPGRAVAAIGHFLADELRAGWAREEALERALERALADAKKWTDSSRRWERLYREAEAELAKLRPEVEPVQDEGLQAVTLPPEGVASLAGALLSGGAEEPPVFDEDAFMNAEPLPPQETAPAEKCRDCDGNGEVYSPNPPAICSACDGHGKLCGWCAEPFGEDHVCTPEDPARGSP